mgnify:CR=1 FL=1
MQMRLDLIEEYFHLYRVRNAQSNLKFRQNYERMSEMWLQFTDHEREAINIMMKQVGAPF